ncbi:MAG: Swarming motility protein YbiA, partial [Flammeovirgaceae bacterium]
YTESDAYGEFSNFARYPIVIDDVLWYTSEHYFQAMKCPHYREYQHKIRKTKACHDIKILGGTRQIKLRPDWEMLKKM